MFTNKYNVIAREVCALKGKSFTKGVPYKLGRSLVQIIKIVVAELPKIHLLLPNTDVLFITLEE